MRPRRRRRESERASEREREREQRRVLRPELSRSHGSSSGSGGDIPTYLPISLAARACVSQATLRYPPRSASPSLFLARHVFLSVTPPSLSDRRTSSFTSIDTVSRTLTRTAAVPRLAQLNPLLYSYCRARGNLLSGEVNPTGNVSNLSRVSGQFVSAGFPGPGCHFHKSLIPLLASAMDFFSLGFSRTVRGLGSL